MLIHIVLLSVAFISLLIFYIAIIKKSVGFMIAGLYGISRAFLGYIPNSEVEIIAHFVLIALILIFAKPLISLADLIIEYYHTEK